MSELHIGTWQIKHWVVSWIKNISCILLSFWRQLSFISDDESEEKKEVMPYWPHWCEYVAWTICILVTLAAAFFTLLYGISFERSKQEEWLVSLFTSVFQDVFISQPIKVTYKILFTPRWLRWLPLLRWQISTTKSSIKFDLNFFHRVRKGGKCIVSSLVIGWNSSRSSKCPSFKAQDW